MGISLDEANRLINLYFDAYPGIKKYIEASHNMAIANGYVIGPFGQRKMEFGAKEIFRGTAVYNGSLRNAQNVRVQNTTSSFGLACFARLNEAIKPLGAKAICTVFDSIELEVPIQVAAQVLELAFYHLNDEPVEIYDWLDLPVGVDGEIGLNWGDAKHIHRGATQEEIEALIDSMNH